MSDVITNNLDLWTSAILNKSTAGRGSNNKQEFYGVKKLRELILDLAVRGELLEQDRNEEPASLLLKKIFSERDRLIKKEELRTKATEEIESSEEYIAIPYGWEYCRLGNLAKFIDYRGKTPKKIESGVPLITAKNVRFGFISREPYEFISEEEYITWMTRGFPRIGDVLFTTEAPLGNVAIVDIEEIFALAQRVICFQLHEPKIAPYLRVLMMSQAFQNQLTDKATGMTATGIKSAKLKEIPVPIPPMQEQHRIAAKVNELMSLCDQLEQQQIESIDAHQILVETLLGTLTNVESAEELSQAWARITEHFDTLFTTEHSIDKIKQTILQLAVMGKLAPQDPNDEPASVLLKNIEKEKERMVEEGLIRKQKPVEEITTKEAPFELPDGWVFARLGNMTKLITKGSSPKWQGVSYTEDPNDILFVTSENVGSYRFLLENLKYVEKKFNEVEPRSILEKGDFLMNIVGASIGRTAIFNIDELANINQAVCLIRTFSEYLNSKYLLHFFNSEVCISYMFDKQVENARANLSMGNIAKFVMPIPPRDEQDRIVAKVNELMMLCDSLKERIADTQTTQIHLADVIVEQAVAQKG